MSLARSSASASSDFFRWPRPIPRSTWSVFVYWMLRVGRDLDPVAPGIQEVEETAVDQFHAHRLECFPHERLVVDRDPEVAHRVGPAIGIPDEIDELVAEIDDRHVRRLFIDREVEETPVEFERLADVPDLDRHVIDSHGMGLGSM